MKYCPHCQEEIDYLDWNGSYSETIYGTCNGTYYLDTENHETDNMDSNDSDNYEDEVDEYLCPKCGHDVCPDDVLDDDDLEVDEDGFKIFPDKEVKKPYVPQKKPSVCVNLLMKRVIN